MSGHGIRWPLWQWKKIKDMINRMAVSVFLDNRTDESGIHSSERRLLIMDTAILVDSPC